MKASELEPGAIYHTRSWGSVQYVGSAKVAAVTDGPYHERRRGYTALTFLSRHGNEAVFTSAEPVYWKQGDSWEEVDANEAKAVADENERRRQQDNAAARARRSASRFEALGHTAFGDWSGVTLYLTPDQAEMLLESLETDSKVPQ